MPSEAAAPQPVLPWWATGEMIEDLQGKVKYTNFTAEGTVRTLGGSSTSFKEVYDVRWFDQYIFINALLGFAVVYDGSGSLVSNNPGNGGGDPDPNASPPDPPLLPPPPGSSGNYSLARILPDPHPNAPWLFCREVAVEGYGVQSEDDRGSSCYEFARITATYKAVPFLLNKDNPNDPSNFLEEELDETAEMTGDPQAFYKFLTSQRQINVPFARSLGGFQWIQHWTEIPDEAFDEKFVLTKLNAVNHQAVTLGKLGNYDTGTILFTGCKAHREFNPFGNHVWNITYTLHVRDIDWNKAYDPNSGDYDFVVNKKLGPTAPPTDGKYPDKTPYNADSIENIWQFPHRQWT